MDFWVIWSIKRLLPTFRRVSFLRKIIIYFFNVSINPIIILVSYNLQPAITIYRKTILYTYRAFTRGSGFTYGERFSFSHFTLIN